jgi:predicted lipoprotein with Yx(FWY)xxD motif
MTLRSHPTRALALLAAVGLAVAVAACGSDDSTSTAGTDSSSSTTAQAPAATGTVVNVADSDLGEILASGGKTLYTYAPDEAGTPSCTDKCATTWPPLLAPDGASADGLDGSLVATVARPDGTKQVTVDGWPVYTYSKDTTAGDVNGQGVGGIWYVIGSDGKKVDTDDAPTVPGGY